MKMKICILIFGLVFILGGCYPPPAANFQQLREANLEFDRPYWQYNICSLPDRPLTYHDVITLVVDQNFEIFVKAQQYAIKHEIATGERLALLPELKVNAESYHRNNLLVVTSRSVATGQVSVVPSIASRRDQFRTNIDGIWSLVDFGLTYFRSRIAQNESYVTLFQLQRISHNLILNATIAYWNALIYQKMVDRFTCIVEKVRSMNDSLNDMINEQRISATDALLKERKLLEIETDILYYQDLYIKAKNELAGYMGIPSSRYFILEDISFEPVVFPTFDIECLEEQGLQNRPELHEKDLVERIKLEEARSVIVEMVPDFKIDGAHHTYNNPFFRYNLWWDIAYSVTWDLLSLPSKFAFFRSKKHEVEKAKLERISMAIGVLTQVNLAYCRYLQTIKDFDPAARLASVGERIHLAKLKEIALGMSSGYDLLKYEMEAFLDEVEWWAAYADVQIALEEIANSVGLPLQYSLLGKTVSLDEP